MAENDQVRLEIAFEGGQIISGTVTPPVSKAFQAAMAENGPVFELEALEGNFLVALGKVVYVKRSSRETQIGFGSAP
ncbi:MAG TPA: hypothetical protein VNB65_06805 [Gaiellaceae bacterium]|nr:hypothetical protein [Gaiellaceae bacterium]